MGSKESDDLLNQEKKRVSHPETIHNRPNLPLKVTKNIENSIFYLIFGQFGY
jgi:hypothetical protein